MSLPLGWAARTLEPDMSAGYAFSANPGAWRDIGRCSPLALSTSFLTPHPLMTPDDRRALGKTVAIQF
jgi:hypothetical protein